MVPYRIEHRLPSTHAADLLTVTMSPLGGLILPWTTGATTLLLLGLLLPPLQK